MLGWAAAFAFSTAPRKLQSSGVSSVQAVAAGASSVRSTCQVAAEAEAMVATSKPQSRSRTARGEVERIQVLICKRVGGGQEKPAVSVAERVARFSTRLPDRSQLHADMNAWSTADVSPDSHAS
ncbi:MAG: hypothetical protein ABIR79_17025 [Candidatus Binatia bacterium]